MLESIASRVVIDNDLLIHSPEILRGSHKGVGRPRGISFEDVTDLV